MLFGKKTALGKATDPYAMNEIDKVQYYRGSISSALDGRQDEEKKWAVGAEVFNAEDGPVLVPDKMQRLHTHYGHYAMNKVLNRINFRAPGVNVLSKSIGSEDKDTAALIRGWWDYYIYSRDVKEDVMDQVAVDALTATAGFFQVGWKNPPKKTDMEEAKERMDMAAAAMETGEDVYAQMVAQDQQQRDLPPDDCTDDHAEGEPYMQHVDVWDMVCCPGFKSLKHSWRGGGWVAKRIILPLGVAQHTKEYKHRDQISASWAFESSSMRDMSHDRGLSGRSGKAQDASESLIEYAILWEVWTAPDPRRGRKSQVYVMSEGCDKLHYKSDNPYEMLDMFPFVDVVLKPKKKASSIYGTWYLQPIWDTLHELDVLRSVTLDRAKTKRNVMLAQANLMSQKEAETIGQSPEGTIHMVKHPDALANVALTAVAPELESETAKAMNDFFMKSGVGSNQMGAYSTPGASATEAALVQQNLNSDTDEMARRFGKAWILACRMMTKLLKEFANPTQMLQASREDGREWGEFTTQDIAGEFDIRLGIGTQEPVDEAVRRKQMIDAMSVINSFAPGVIKEDLIIPDFLELEGFPNARDYVRDEALWDQKDEFTAMLMGNNIQVQPDDRHYQHMRDGSKVLSMIHQGLQANMQKGIESPPHVVAAAQMLEQHLAMHQQFIQQEAGNAQGSLPAMKMDAPAAAAGGTI